VARTPTPGILLRTPSDVAKVQFALFALDSSAIDTTEARLQTYGPSTAKAALAYKTQRRH
jgi:hypothetical protein